MLNKYLDKLERKFGKYAVSQLMLFIVIGMGIVYVFDYFLSVKPENTVSITQLLYFDLDEIKHGQVWRAISFLLLPPLAGNVIFVAFELYFLWLYGESLESQWGCFKFNVFYLIGVIATIITGLLTGYAVNAYLNLSLFLAFAIVFPDYVVNIFFIIPVKVKWLGMLVGVGMVWNFITGTWQVKFLILIAFANIILFFGKDFFSRIYYFFRRYYYKWFKKMR